MSEIGLFPPEPPVTETVVCDDFDRKLDSYISERGYRLYSIFPADSPRQAIVEREGKFILLEKKGGGSLIAPEGFEGPVIARQQDARWHAGRAGMEYRDLIPDRAGGRLIASHIRILKGGPVPDYVHFHKIYFQVIYCLRGSSLLVYEGQGPPFRFEPGDCVLQPPGIRHRVLECSDGFEVLELSSPAEHFTYADHSLELPDGNASPDRLYEAQKFYLLDASDASWSESEERGFERLITGLSNASAGSIDLTVFRSSDPPGTVFDPSHEAPAFLFVTKGAIETGSSAGAGRLQLASGSCCFVPAGSGISFAAASEDLEFLYFRFPSL